MQRLQCLNYNGTLETLTSSKLWKKTAVFLTRKVFISVSFSVVSYKQGLHIAQVTFVEKLQIKANQVKKHNIEI